MQRPDDELMAQGARGDEDAFRILVERWETPIFGFLLRMLGSREDAQDLCQEAFIRMIRSADSYKAKGQFQSWLFRIAGNLARSKMRRRKILGWLSFDQEQMDPPSKELDPSEELEGEQLRVRVQEAIAKLPDRQKQALLLKQYQGLKHREIAEVMDLSTNAVQMLLHRAMQALRKEFSRRGDIL